LEKLSGYAAALLNLASFFNPKEFEESMICKGVRNLEASGKARKLVFISDELEQEL